MPSAKHRGAVQGLLLVLYMNEMMHWKGKGMVVSVK